LEIFNLTDAFSTLTNNAPNRLASYFTSTTDAENNTNAVTETAFNNTENPQIIYVKIM